MSLLGCCASQARVFSRFSQSQAATFHAPATPPSVGDESLAPSAFYRRGTRHYSAEQIDALAQQIVTRLKARGAPFMSVEDFLSASAEQPDSLIEQAIAAALTRNGRQQWDHTWETDNSRSASGELIDIDYLAPGFLTQADIMTAIGPMLAARSDTFKIRARGICLSATGEALGSATLEATLQRTPEALEPTTTLAATHRKFKQLSTRWLAASER